MISCPACSESMSVVDINGLEIDECRHCDGMWLDRGEPERLSFLDVVRKGLLQPTGFDDTRRVVPRAERGCPRCGSIFDHYRIRGITVDVCPDCRGLWLERWGLQKVLSD
ncbi:MAG: zf-TFIIB domain-containing protein [Armatimonadetes bacterium]|nr:zf-TFIIB domain-containing protein [Armatimonadota bacterium]